MARWTGLACAPVSFPTRRCATQLESLLHPMIRDCDARTCGRDCIAEGAPYVVLVVPLLVETGNWRGYADRVLVVDCSEATQMARVRARGQGSTK